MQIELTIKNYRCFPDIAPVRLVIRHGQIMAFLGANNSGKSSLIRFLYEFRSLFNIIVTNQNNWALQALRQPSHGLTFPSPITDPAEVFSDRNDRPLNILLSVSQHGFEQQQAQDLIVSQASITIDRLHAAWQLDFSTSDGKKVEGDIKSWQAGHLDVRRAEGKYQINHTPIIRACQQLSNTLYIGPFRNAINMGSGTYYDINVGQQFITDWRNFKTGPNKRQSEAILQLTKSIQHLFDLEQLEINPSTDNSTLQIYLNGKSYKLTELGAGLAQFIVVLGSAAVKQPDFILIDEPELNLHPSLQLDFLTTLAAYARIGVMFATHSIGLARSAGDPIYTVRKISHGHSEVKEYEATPNLAELLGELSYSGYRELGFDRVLLVEGPHEVRTLQCLLRLYDKDHKVVLLPLGGSQGIRQVPDIELQEIKRITSNVSALIDSERSEASAPLDAKRVAFVEACKRNDITCHPLERRAIENYFTDSTVKSVFSDKYSALKPYERLQDLAHGWSKSENWRIASAMSRADLDATDLGKFLADI